MLLRGLKRWVALAALVLTLGLAICAPAFGNDDRKIKSKVNPVYPELAKKMNVTGVVKVQVTVAANGTVKSAKAIGGHPLLIDPAVDAVKKWRYEPGAEDSTEVVEFRFDPNN